MKSKILSSETKFVGHSFQVLSQDITLPTGEHRNFEIIDRSDVALIIPMLSESEAVVIYQFRAAVDGFIWEFPAGKKIISESIEETALRELEEETGYVADKISLLGTFYTAPHFTNEKVYVFVATQLRKKEKKLEQNEFIKVRKADYEELQLLFENAEIKDAKSLIACQMFNKKKSKNG